MFLNKYWIKGVVGSLGVGLAISLPFWLSDIDIWFSYLFFHPEKEWYLTDYPPWRFIYLFTSVPAVVIGMLFLIAISLSYTRKQWLQWRKPGFHFLLTLIIGPGILVNLVFKDNWGRPRPRDILEFGGKEQYHAVLLIGDDRRFKSFPCGHCSMGFVLAAPFMFLIRRRKVLAYTVLAFGIATGFLVGLTRILAGGHFLSDVIWSGVFVAVAAFISYRLVRLDINLKWNEHRVATSKWLSLGVGGLVPLLLFFALVATPYRERWKPIFTEETLKNEGVEHLILDMGPATTEITFGDTLIIESEINAFGLPTSKYLPKWYPADTAVLTFHRAGIFTDLNNDSKIILADFPEITTSVEMEKGDAYVTMLPAGVRNMFDLILKQGDLHILISDNSPPFLINHNKRLVQNNTSIEIDISENRIRYLNSKPQIIINLDQMEGKIILAHVQN